MAGGGGAGSKIAPYLSMREAGAERNKKGLEAREEDERTATCAGDPAWSGSLQGAPGLPVWSPLGAGVVKGSGPSQAPGIKTPTRGFEETDGAPKTLR